MSVDPDQPSASDPTPPKSPGDPTSEGADALRLKRRFKKGAESEDGEKPDQTIQLLSTLLQDLIAKKELPAAPESETRSTTKYHRLSKTGSGAPAGPTDPAPGFGFTEPAPPAAGVAAVPPPPPPPFRAAPESEPLAQARRVRHLHILYPLAALLLAGAAYVAGSRYGAPNTLPESPGKPTAAAPATGWTDAMLSQLDQALAADQAGDLKGAQRLASAIKKPDTASPPGLDLYLAGITTREDHTYDVEADLLRALSNATPEFAAALNERLAFNFSRTRDFEKAADFSKTASRLDPFSAPLFYHWGETLRHLGHFQEAADVFRRALERIPTGQPETDSLRECINLKQRLALVEQARDGELQVEMAEQLKAAQPSGYWLLTAAAVALQHKNLAEAAGFLGRARDALGTVQFNELLNDYLFRAYADRKELADFFPPDPTARRAKLLPTMAYTVEP